MEIHKHVFRVVLGTPLLTERVEVIVIAECAVDATNAAEQHVLDTRDRRLQTLSCTLIHSSVIIAN